MDQTTQRTDHGDAPADRGDGFNTTHWTVILNARAPDSEKAAVALDQLCQSYWQPLYVYVLRRGFDPHSAEDLTQEFFARFLARNDLAGVRPEKGRFRSFLLVSLKNFLCDDRDKVSARKRGGGHQPVSLDSPLAAGRAILEPVDNMDPEKVYDRRWALTLLERAWEKLEAEFAASGQSALFVRLQACQWRGPDQRSHAQIARELGLTEGAVKAHAHRFRQRYRELTRAEVAHTVGHPSEIDGELRHLFAAVSG